MIRLYLKYKDVPPEDKYTLEQFFEKQQLKNAEFFAFDYHVADEVILKLNSLLQSNYRHCIIRHVYDEYEEATGETFFIGSNEKLNELK